MPEMKRCAQCGEHKPADLQHFYKNKRMASGLSSYCRICTAKNRREYVARNPEKVKTQLAESRLGRKEKQSEYMRAYYAEKMKDPAWKEKERIRHLEKARRERSCTPERHRQRVRAWRCRNPYNPATENPRRRERYRSDSLLRERIVQKSREFRRLHPDKVRRTNRNWIAANPERHRLNTMRWRALRRAAGKLSREDLKAQLERQNHCCAYCGEEFTDVLRPTADHVLPVSKGGLTTPENIVLACLICNSSKNNRTPWEWMPDRFSPPEQHATD